MKPTAPAPAPPSDAAIRAGSKSFALASRVFDETTRQQVWDLYAWCRHCDDAVDGQTLGYPGEPEAEPAARLAEVAAQTDLALGDEAISQPAVFAGLRRLRLSTSLPSSLPREHLRGFAMDVGGRTYDSLDDTLEYCYHVAGVVGLMMAWIMGVRDAATLQRACDLGLAFQLTNIARDVGGDLSTGRVYLPREWLRDAGATLVPWRPLDADTAGAIVPVVARLLDEADRFYLSAWHGVGRLPWRSAWAVAAARHIYRDIGVEVRRRGPAAWSDRVTTSRARKSGRLMQALGEAVWATSVGQMGTAPSRDALWTPPRGSMLG